MQARYAIIENGVVTNVVIAEPAVANDFRWIASNEASPGWTYAKGKFSPPVDKPPTVPTVAEKLAAVGIGVDELKAALR